MKLLYRTIISIILILAGLTVANAKTTKEDINETFLEGKISGTFNGKAFTHNDSESRDKIRTTNNHTSLIQTFMVKNHIINLITNRYDGKGKYQDDMRIASFILMTKPRDKYKTVEKTITIIEDSPIKLIGNFAFTVSSTDNEKITVDGSFDYKKIIVDNNDDTSVLKELKKNPALMKSLGEKRSDKDFIIKAINQKGLVFNYIDDELQKDKEFILRALKEGPRNIFVPIKMTAGKELLQDKKFALKMLAINPMVIHILDKDLKQDKEIIKASKK